MTVGLALLGARTVSGQVAPARAGDSPPPAAGTRVRFDYRPDPAGAFVVRENAALGPGTGFARFSAGRRSPFSSAWEEALLPDPTVLPLDGWYYITGSGDGMLRRTGVSGVALHDPDPYTANFMIWRTRDWLTFEPFKWAFDDRPRGPGRRVNELPAGSGRWFARLQAPQLVQHPLDPESIYLVFHGVEQAWVPRVHPSRWGDPAVWRTSDPRAYRNTLYPDPDLRADIDWRDVTHPASRGRDYGNAWDAGLPRYSLYANYLPERFSSCFTVRTTRRAFLDPGAQGVDPERRPAAFAGAHPAWFAYADPATGQEKLDGGRSIGRRVPVGGGFALANARSFPGLGLTFEGESPSFAEWGDEAWIFGDAYVFFDPRAGHRPWLFYTWNDGRSVCDDSPPPGAETWRLGNNIAFHPMQAGVQTLHRLDASGTLLPLAASRIMPRDRRDAVWAHPSPLRWPSTPAGVSVATETYMKPSTQANGVIGVQAVWTPERGGRPNLACDAPHAPAGQHTLFAAPATNGWGVAEGPAVFHRSGRYYAIYSRNMWDAAAYQLVYRSATTLEELSYGVRAGSVGVGPTRSGAGEPGSARNPIWSPSDPASRAGEERVLLVTERPDVPTGRSFGHADVFRVADPRGGEALVYLVLQFKEDGSNYRHPWVKELRFAADGGIEPLFEDLDRDGLLERNDGPGAEAAGGRTARAYDPRADARVFLWPAEGGGGVGAGGAAVSGAPPPPMQPVAPAGRK